MANSDLNRLTEEEKELYDRQIRLWGLESQKRLRGAKVLLIGLNGLGAEIVKNIVLAGIQSIHLMDTVATTESDFRTQFLINPDQLGHNRAEASVERAQALNPLVKVSAENSNIFSKPDDIVKDYDIVIATGFSHSQIIKMNNNCRNQGTKFFACNVNGLFGYSLVDLIEHEYAEETVTLKPAPLIDGKRGKPEEIVKTVKRISKYPTLEDTLDVDFTSHDNAPLLSKLDQSYFIIKGLIKFIETEKREPDPLRAEQDMKKLKDICLDIAASSSYPSDKITDELLSSIFINVNPVCAIVGGLVGQEVIKVISQVNQPIRNILYFDPIKSCANVITVGC